MSSSDGLHNDEITKLLFKSYMNSTTTSNLKAFYEENILANNSNIFSSGVLIDRPPVYNSTPSLIPVTDHTTLSNYLSYFCSQHKYRFRLVSRKTDNSGTFHVNSTDDNERTILRLENIKLDYLGSGSCAFTCFDNSGVNILQNIIPSNYSTSGYSIALLYDTGSDTLKNIGWLTSSSDLNEDFGGALYDAKKWYNNVLRYE